MDGVQMPLSASVGAKLLDQENIHGIGDSGCRDPSTTSVAADSGKPKACSEPFPKDTGLLTPSGQLSSYSQHKKEFDRFSNDKYGINGRNLSSGEMDSFLTTNTKPESKNLQKKSGRRSNNSPSSKRPRSDLQENSMSSFIMGCTSSETSRTVKQKVGTDGKRCDRKNSRITGKSKIDSFAVKNGLSCSDIAAGGNNLLGSYNLKPDTRDLTKDIEEPSLAALLDGSYTCPILCQEKAKKTSSMNEPIFHSFRKAFSVLHFRSTNITNSNRENSTISATSIAHSTEATECMDSDKCIEQTMSCSKFIKQETVKEMKSMPSLYRPHDIFERLALPASQDLDSLLCNQNVLSVSRSHRSSPLLKVCGASLPPFPWSSSQCKPPVDTGKLGLGRSLSQGRWFRINRHACSVKNDSISSQLDLHPTNPIMSLQKYKELLHDATTLTMSYSLPSHSIGTSCKTVTKSSFLMNKRYMVCSGHIVDISAGYEHCLKLEKDICSITGDVSSLSIQGGKASSADILSVNNDTHVIGDCERDDSMKATYSGIDTHKKQSSAVPSSEFRNSGHSPRAVVAADILCDMRGSDNPKKAEHNSGKTRWPNSPLQVTMKARKVRPLPEKCDGTSVERGLLGNPIKTMKFPASQSKSLISDDRRDTLSLKSDAREPIRWSAVSERSYHIKVEKDPSTNTRQSHGIMRPMDILPPLKRIGKSREAHHKQRKDVLATTSYSNAVIFSKDWSRGKSRRD